MNLVIAGITNTVNNIMAANNQTTTINPAALTADATPLISQLSQNTAKQKKQ